MQPKRSPSGIYLIVVIVIIVFSLVLVGDNSSHFGQSQTPGAYRQAIPKSDSGAHALGSQNDRTNLQVNNFGFITLTPSPVPPDPNNNVGIFTTTDAALSDQADFAAEQQDYIDTYGFTKTNVMIDNTPAIELTGTMPYQDVNGKHIQGPAQVSVIYVMHGEKITKFEYSYLGDTPDPDKESLLSKILSTVKLI